MLEGRVNQGFSLISPPLTIIPPSCVLLNRFKSLAGNMADAWTPAAIHSALTLTWIREEVNRLILSLFVSLELTEHISLSPFWIAHLAAAVASLDFWKSHLFPFFCSLDTVLGPEMFEGVTNFSTFLLDRSSGMLFLGARGAILAVNINDLSQAPKKVVVLITIINKNKIKQNKLVSLCLEAMDKRSYLKCESFRILFVTSVIFLRLGLN